MNRHDGKIERIEFSKIRVKSNCLIHGSTRGPNIESVAPPQIDILAIRAN